MPFNANSPTACTSIRGKMMRTSVAAFAVPCVEVTAAKWKRAAEIALVFDKEHLRQMALVAALAGPSQAPPSQA